MIDHVTLRVQDFSRAVAFYRAALGPIGYEVMMEYPNAVGMGAGKPVFWIMESSLPVNPTHLAFAADRPKVDAFHAAALAAGGSDNGPPGLRLDYHPHYYGAFVTDPEGNNIEVVCHDNPAASKPIPTRKAATRKPAKRAVKAAAKRAARPSPKISSKASSKKSAKASAPKKKSAKGGVAKKRR